MGKFETPFLKDRSGAFSYAAVRAIFDVPSPQSGRQTVLYD